MKTISIQALRGKFVLLDPHPTEGASLVATVDHNTTTKLTLSDVVFERVTSVLNDFQTRKLIAWAETGAATNLMPAPEPLKPVKTETPTVDLTTGAGTAPEPPTPTTTLAPKPEPKKSK